MTIQCPDGSSSGGPDKRSRRIPPELALSRDEVWSRIEKLQPAEIGRWAWRCYRKGRARGLPMEIGSDKTLLHDGYDVVQEALLAILSGADDLANGVERKQGRRLHRDQDLFDQFAASLKSTIDGATRRRERSEIELYYEADLVREGDRTSPLEETWMRAPTPEQLLLDRESQPPPEPSEAEAFVERVEREMRTRPDWYCFFRRRAMGLGRQAIMLACGLTAEGYEAARKKFRRVVADVEKEGASNGTAA
jgi:hypothetical protein